MSVLLEWSGPRRKSWQGMPERILWRVVEEDGARWVESALQEYPDQPLLSRPLIWERDGGAENAERELARRKE